VPDTGCRRLLVAEPLDKVTVSVSTFPAESVIVSVKVPLPAADRDLRRWPRRSMIRTRGFAVHAYDAMLSGTGGNALALQPGRLRWRRAQLPA
jgi:hypothetical protein